MYFNFFALEDTEFEELSRDILSRTIKQDLRIFKKGADQGIDIADCIDGRTVIAQCKNYRDTPYTKLLQVLDKEKKKVQQINPKEYYLFINKDLSPKNINDIYQLFSKWMSSTKNIYTRSDCDEYISKIENHDIAQKYPHLLNLNSLHSLINSGTIIDNQDLFSSMENFSKFFVETNQYRHAMSLLENNQIVLISGAPGTGKTITSKMLAVQYAYYGQYSLHYYTGDNIYQIKNALSPQLRQKEFIFIDDVFGQHYHDMNSTKESLLKQLIHRVKNSQNKRMLINTRMTILQETQQRVNFADGTIDGKDPFIIVDMNQISLLEKAEIFVNHLRYRNVDREYINEIKKGHAYLQIIKHVNYTPRIIDRCTQEKYVHATEANQYVSHILNTLKHANELWNDEFRFRLSEPDRILLYTLYSLTNHKVREDILQRAVNARLNPPKASRESVNISDILKRLNESMITIDYKANSRMIGTINPSVNDYLRTQLCQTPEERNRIIEHAAFMNQIERISKCIDNNDYKNEVISQLIDKFISGNSAPGYTCSTDSDIYTNASLLALAKQRNYSTIDISSYRFRRLALSFMDAVLQGKIGFTDNGVKLKTLAGYSYINPSFLPTGLEILMALNDNYTILNQWQGDIESIENILNASDGLGIKSQLCSLFFTKARTMLDQTHMKALSDVIIDNLDAEIDYIEDSTDISMYCDSSSTYFTSSYEDYDDEIWEISYTIAHDVQSDIDNQTSILPDDLKSQLKMVDISDFEDAVSNELARYEQTNAMEILPTTHNYARSGIESESLDIDSRIDTLFKNL